MSASSLPTAYCPLPTHPIASARIRTWNTAFEAPHDRPFHHEGVFVSAFCLLPSALDSEPSAGIEPATRRYEGRVMPTSPIGQ